MAADVREPDSPNETLFDEAGEGPYRGAPGRPGIRGVQEVEVDRHTLERRDARLAAGENGLRAAVRHPSAACTRHAALRHDASVRVRPALPQRPGQQPLVVTELVLAVAVGVGGVEGRYSDLNSGGDRLDGQPLVAVLVRRHAHAAEADPQLRRVKPWGHAAPRCHLTRRRTAL